MVLVDNSNPLAFVDTNVTTFSLPSNRITLSKQFDFVLDSANTIRIIKKGNSIWLPAYESNYLLIPIVDIESFIYVINSYKRGILEIKYKNSIPSTCIQIDKNFNETEFSLYFKYGIQKYNSTISLQKKQSKDWIVYVITVLLSGLMIFYLTRSFIRLFK